MASAARKPSVRRDPPPSELGFGEDTGEVLNKDPKKHYVWVYKVGNQVGAYENRGFDVELNRPDGPRAAVQRKNRAHDIPVEWNDCLLMSIDKADHEAQVQRGQRHTDAIERQIIDQEGSPDLSRGIGRNRHGRPVVELQNETSTSEMEG